MADFNFYDNLQDDDNDNNEMERFAPPGRDSVIIAVDCCSQMFESTGDEMHAFAKVIEAIKDLLRNRIICSDKDLHAVVLFGTEKHNNPSDFEHIYVVQDLEVPSASRIEELQILQDADDSYLEDTYGLRKQCLIAELLWCCTSMFSRCTMKMSSKTVMIFTWDDNPHQDNKNLRLRAMTKAKDLIEQETNVQILSFNPNFNYDKFYKGIRSETEIDASLVENPINGIADLYDFLLRKCTKQRPIANVGFQLADGVEMAVGIYTPIRRATKTKSVSIDPKTNKEVMFKRNFVEKETAEILMMSDINYSQTWGGRSIIFEYEELQSMKRFAGAGLKLLGFKPKAKALKMHHHVRTAQFIYPNEKSVVGSTKLFSALLKRCSERDVIPICSLSARDNSPPRLVALLPQPEEVDEESGEQLQPPGFYVIFVPFSEDIRSLDIEESNEPDHESVQTATDIIRKLKFTYQPSNFENPVLQTHYRNLEAMALEKDEPDSVEDFTLPNEDRIEKKAGALISRFKELVFPPDYDPNKKTSSAGTKRKLANSDGGPAAKQLNMAEIKTMAETGGLMKLTVPVLKDICKSRGLNAVGRKKDLISTIVSSFEN